LVGEFASIIVDKFTLISANSPKELLEGYPFQIACGAKHVLVLTSNGLVFGAGCNQQSALGIYNKVNRSFFSLVSFQFYV
jgi:alpha-tubulin suppressor-like RCC1 family protein